MVAFAIGGAILGAIVSVKAQSNTTDNAAQNMSMDMGGGDTMRMIHEKKPNHKWGMISSINNDGQTEWIISSHWMMEMKPQNDTAASKDTIGRASNIAGFNAILHMVMPDGSAMHNHEISNFTQTGDAMFDSGMNTTTITGTATVTMRKGQVPNVPTAIQIAQDQVIAI